ncbi:MAG: integration host factor, actinobacterial type [Cumulibacter sp.]|uniref:integration host factor, actinobacterial type n=1 Tax=Cumulibacter soli TaxID=2546344 RepID=UPI0010675128|nr:integration host factor, actinobacterial type [Cumulibacter soli]
MTLPHLTPEDRAAALQAAVDARRRRAEFKESLRRGELTLADVLERAKTDEVVSRTPIVTVLESMPGIGKVKAGRIMERVGISESRRVRGLGAKQRVALEEELAGR